MPNVDSCCQLVGDLKIAYLNGTEIPGCITSISVDSSTEIIDVCDTPLPGATVGTINVSGYAGNTTYVGCPSKAGVSINWQRRFDCEITHFIKTGEGISFMSLGQESDRAKVEDYVKISSKINRKYPVLNASSSSGPYSLYMKAQREDGYGMIYTGDLFPFNTAGDLIFGNIGVGSGNMYLQSFSIDFTPGSYPTVSFSFGFSID